MASSYLSRTFTGSYNAGTISMWIKRTNLGSQYIIYNESSSDSNDYALAQFDSGNKIEFMTVTNGTHTQKLITNREFKDVNAYYHLVFSMDTDNSTADNRLRIYVNGEEETSMNTRDNGSQGDTNYMFQTSATNKHRLFASSGGSANLDAIVSHVHIVPNAQLAPTVFGEFDSTSGIWKPKTSPSVTYTSQGVFLKFENSANMGLDSSGNSNNMTVSGTITQQTDTPSNVFPTISKVMQPTDEDHSTISNGGLTNTSSSGDYSMVCSMGAKKGKWYWEVKMGNDSNRRATGVVRLDKLYQDSSLGGFYPGGNNNSTTYTSAYTSSHGFIETNTNGTRVQVTSGVNNSASGDIIGMYLDLDNYTLKFYRNNALENEAALDSTWVRQFVAPCARADHNQIMQFNFGSGYFGTTAVSSANADANGFGAFEYSPTLSGVNYYAWCTKNIQEFG